MSYCGPQYASANCQCYLQLTPGISPGSSVATTTPLCAFRLEGKQYACDPGCCPKACTVDNSAAEPMETETPKETSYKFTTEDWLLIVLAIIFCILLLAGVAWGSRRRKNLGG